MIQQDDIDLSINLFNGELKNADITYGNSYIKFHVNILMLKSFSKQTAVNILDTRMCDYLSGDNKRQFLIKGRKIKVRVIEC